MALADRLHNTMRIVTTAGTGALIEGQRDEQEQFSAVIRCLLTTAPTAQQAAPSGRRDQVGPVLLCAPRDATGAAIALRPGVTVEVTAPIVHAAEGVTDPARYEIEGVQPLARPGSLPMGFNASLVRVTD